MVDPNLAEIQSPEAFFLRGAVRKMRIVARILEMTRTVGGEAG